QCALWRHFEDRATETIPPIGGCAIEIAIGRLHQASEWSETVSAVHLRTKSIDRCQRARGSQFKDCAAIKTLTVGAGSGDVASRHSRPVEIPVGGLNQRTQIWALPIAPGKTHQGRK